MCDLVVVVIIINIVIDFVCGLYEDFECLWKGDVNFDFERMVCLRCFMF